MLTNRDPSLDYIFTKTNYYQITKGMFFIIFFYQIDLHFFSYTILGGDEKDSSRIGGGRSPVDRHQVKHFLSKPLVLIT